MLIFFVKKSEIFVKFLIYFSDSVTVRRMYNFWKVVIGMDAALVTGMFNFGFKLENTLSRDVGRNTDSGFKDVFSKELENKKGNFEKKENINEVSKKDDYEKDVKKNEDTEKSDDVKKEDNVKDTEKVDEKTKNKNDVSKKDEEGNMTDKINGLVEQTMKFDENVDVNNLDKADVHNIEGINEELLKLQDELKLESSENVLEVGPHSVETEKITSNKYEDLENELEALRKKLGAFDEDVEEINVDDKVIGENMTELSSEFESSFSGEEEFTSAKDGKEEKKINVSDFRKKEVVDNKGEQVDFNIEDIKTTTEENVIDSVTEIIQDSMYDMQEQIDVIKQISEQIDINLFEDKSEMIVKLKPDHLGKVTVEIAVENGNITAKFLAESQKVKEILESSMQDLKDHLAKQGMMIQDLSVSVGNDNNPHFSERNYKTFKRRQKVEAVNNEIYSAENSYGIDEDNISAYWPDSTVSFSA